MRVFVAVEVVDETGGDLDFKATLGGVTMSDVPPLGICADLAAVGSGVKTLVLEVKDHPPLPFQLDVTPGKGVTFEGVRPRCCTASRQAAFEGPISSPALVTLKFALHKKHHEVVFVTGWDYSGGAKMIDYATTWRDDLYDGSTWVTGKQQTMPQALFDHTVVTIFEADTGDRIRFIKGTKGWHEMDRVLQGTVRPKRGKYDAEGAKQALHDEDSISIVHAYKYVEDLGTTAPKCLSRFEIFSHAYQRGPIFVNTDEAADWPDKADGARDPGDKDGRADRDFNGKAFDLAKFKAAFDPDGLTKVWGCFYLQGLRDLIQEAARARDGSVELKHWPLDGTMTPDGLPPWLQTEVMPKIYLVKLATAAGVKCFGTPLGLGSDVKDVGRRSYQFVDPTRFGLEYGWWKDEFGKEPDIAGYVPYS